MSEYEAVVPVRFAEIDRAGIVYYPRWFHYLHVAFEEFCAARMGVPYNEMIDRRRVGFPTVRAECDYSAPLRFGDRMRIGISVERLGRSSAVFLYRVRTARSRRPHAEARITVVCVDMDTFKSRPIPRDCRRVFERHMTKNEGKR
jgi:4-hydroxybenzoyl-CoA thioesterase